MEFTLVRYFDSPSFLLYGIFIGLLVGFLLQKGRLSYYNVIVGQFLFRDFTLAKVILWAVLTAGILMQVAFSWGVIVASPVSPVLFSSALVGGGLVGLGMALLGYCPASCCAAVGQGSRDAFFGILGMFGGGLFFQAIYPVLIPFFTGEPAQQALDSLLGIGPWLIFALLALVLLLVNRYFAR